MNARSVEDEPGFIWATRGHAWGFRFLRSAGLDDPLGAYEDAFADADDRSEFWLVHQGRAALRFPDPLGRCDSAGRIIPHDFVLFGAWVDGIDSFEEGRERMWREVEDEFEGIWDKETPPLQH